MFYRTGDLHGEMDRLAQFCRMMKENGNPLTREDTIIVLGDAGINYYEYTDRPKRKLGRDVPATLFLVHGNHERNPEYMPSMKEKLWNGGTVFYEEAYPYILYGKDGEFYDMDGKSAVVLGGAYSVDKDYRLQKGYSWFSDEQMSEEVQQRCVCNLEEHGWEAQLVLSHTVPLRFMPVEDFLPMIDQSKVDKTMEIFLQDIQNKLTYERWFAGHYHCDKKKHDELMHKPPVEIMYWEVCELLGSEPLYVDQAKTQY